MSLINRKIRFNECTAIPFHQIDKEGLKQILEWRNDKSIRKWMEDNSLIDSLDHFQFVEKLRDRKDCIYLRIDEKNKPLGVVNLINIDIKNATAELGIYRRPDIKQLGAGNKLLKILERIACEIKLNRLYLKVMHDNERAYRLYIRNKFEEYKKDSYYIYMQKNINEFNI